MTGQSPVYVCTVLRARGASHLYALQLELQLALRLVDVEGAREETFVHHRLMPRFQAYDTRHKATFRWY